MFSSKALLDGWPIYPEMVWGTIDSCRDDGIQYQGLSVGTLFDGQSFCIDFLPDNLLHDPQTTWWLNDSMELFGHQKLLEQLNRPDKSMTSKYSMRRTRYWAKKMRLV